MELTGNNKLEASEAFRVPLSGNGKIRERTMEKDILNRGEVTRLNESELQEQLLNNAQVAIIIADINRKIECTNPEFTRMFGYNAGEAIGK